MFQDAITQAYLIHVWVCIFTLILVDNYLIENLLYLIVHILIIIVHKLVISSSLSDICSRQYLLLVITKLNFKV